MGISRSAATLVGRAAESAQLGMVLSTALTGSGRAVVVCGEAGIGKSALLTACADQAERAGFTVLRGSASEIEQQFPLWPFLELLRTGSSSAGQLRQEYRAAVAALRQHSADAMADPVPAVAERLFQAVERQCAGGPVLLVLDDLQWADEMSAALWIRLARQAKQLPLVMAAAVRSGAGEGEVSAVLRGLERGNGLTIRLGPLSDHAVMALANNQLTGPAAPSLLRELGRAGGNPLHVTELLALLRENGALATGPHGLEVGPGRHDLSLGATITDRIQHLSAELREMLGVAAVLGPEFQLTDLSTVSGRPLVGLLPIVDEALAAGVLVPAGERLSFRHHLIWLAFADSIPAALRGVLHKQVAEALARTGAPLEQVASQLLQADDAGSDAWAVGWTAGHARELVDRSPTVAVGLLARAVAVRLPAVDLTALRLRTVEALIASARPEEAEALAREVLAEGSIEPDDAAEASWLLARALHAQALSGGGLHDAAEVVTAATRIDGMSERCSARLLAESAFHLFWSDRPVEAIEAAAQAVISGERSGESFALAYARWMQVVMARVHDGNLAAALELSTRGLALCADGTHPRIERLIRTERVMITGALDRLVEAEQEITEIRRVSDRLAAPDPGATAAIAAHRFRTGQWDDALVELDRLNENVYEHAAVLSRGLTALVAAHRDDRATCEAQLHLMRDHRPEAPAGHEAAQWLLMARSVAAERSGLAEQALAALRPVLDPKIAAVLEDPCDWLPIIVRLALAIGDRATAEAAAAVRPPGPTEPSTAYRHHAALHCAGLLAGDSAALVAAADYYASSSRPLRQANALEDAAELLASQGSPIEAKRRLDDAVAAYTGLGALWDARRARARLRARGIRQGARGPRVRATSGWASLTATELRVANLVAVGRSNPEIAAEMLLSARTVQSHVSHILAKLSFRSRVEIAGEAARRGLTEGGG
ncbi:helix-turn-helix transcriptional regulator [Kitasatospora sp. NPDC056138]|uniref:helix-turn-helix transcriptional regulator n=1 Tax=Kitasatospora sp. NPDC056138 TaxID=3345724 RepID=UPI0035D5F871